MHPQSTPFQLFLFDKRCTLCGIVQPRSNFGAYANHSDGLRSYCKTCATARYQAFRSRHGGPCAHEDCIGRPYRQSLCAKHYRAALAAGTLRPPVPVVQPLPDDLTALDLAWMAGLFDGEGTIFISRMRPRDRARNPHYEAGAAVGMTSEETVRVFGTAFGGHVCRRKPHTAHHKTQWRWRVTQWKGVRFLRAIRPYLRLKGPQADLALIFMDKTLGRHRGSPPLSETELAERAAMYDQMIMLNGNRFGRRYRSIREPSPSPSPS